jgi:CHASE1-domain containing sensor protein
MNGRATAVCSALKSREFLQDNNLRLVQKSGPKSGQSTTVVYTYEFVNTHPASQKEDSWMRLRGALKDVYAELGGGEAYLRNERDNFPPLKESE